MTDDLLLCLFTLGIIQTIILWVMADYLLDIVRELREIKEKLTIIIHFKEMRESLSKDR